MNTKELTALVEEQGARIEALEARLEKALAWATTAQAHILALEGRAAPAPKTESNWKSGVRPSHPVRRPAAPAAAAAELPPEPEEFPPCAGSEVPEDCPF
jgi:hypothetical protein